MSGFGSGTEFISVLSPPWDALNDYDNTKRHNEQPPSIPQGFRDALAVREGVFVDEQGTTLDAEVDADDKRSWHWVVYASVGTSASPPPANLTDPSPASKAEDQRRRSATAQSLPVGTIRLIPPPHGPNKYIKTALPKEGDKHPDADPPPSANVEANVVRKHPTEPYIKLGRLAVLAPFRSLGLSKLLINTALEFAAKNPQAIRPPPSPTTLEFAKKLGKQMEEAAVWKGLAMVHAQVTVAGLYAKFGFTEELIDENGEVEISKEDRWYEEGIEHLGMWKRIKCLT